MFYTRLSVECSPELGEIIIAELAEAGFDTFMEVDNGIEAFVENENFNKSLAQEILATYSKDHNLSYRFDQIEKRNWNEEWENNYEPIDVEGKCLIRAEFHRPDRKYPNEIIITPKMSFGTGHHQTTYLMIKNQMTIDHHGKRVMDAGCGTAILSIMASKLGASEAEAFDIDDWSVVNGEENKLLNHTHNIHIQQGTITQVTLDGSFDIILANINKNVLLNEMRHYAKYLNAGGTLLLSGFYTKDISDLTNEATKHGLKEVSRDERENWACLRLVKS